MKIINDNYLYAKVAKYIEDKSKLCDESIPSLTDVVGDEDKAKEIVDAAKASMGRDPLLYHLCSVDCPLFTCVFANFLQDRICPQLI